MFEPTRLQIELFLNDEGGTIHIFAVRYDESMRSPFLKQRKHEKLEDINI